MNRKLALKDLIIKTIGITTISILIFSCTTTKSDTSEPRVDYLDESGEAFNERMEWWRDARFGMFIHWGVYAVPAGVYKEKEVAGIGEWIMKKGEIPIDEYEAMASQWNPEEFDADQWVRIMKDAGMKYMVITSKHHDGFGLWDSKVSDYDIVDVTPYGKDVLKPLSEACRKYGIKFGLYHSIMDWHHPQAQADSYLTGRDTTEQGKQEFKQYFDEYLKPQLKELIENYDPAILWFDGEWVPEYTHEQGLELYQYVRSLKPDILINNRVDKGRQGMQGMDKADQDYAGDFGTPEQEILEGTSTFDWESCMTMNDTWGFKKNDDNWKSSEVLIHNLIDVAAKGGNYLLNVGPTAAGNIPQPSIGRLADIGDWLDVNGEAIYGTAKLNYHYKEGEAIRYTRKKDEPFFYAISLEAPGDEIILSYLRPEAGSAIKLLGFDEPLEWNYSENGLIIQVPESAQEMRPAAWTFKITGQEIAD